MTEAARQLLEEVRKLPPNDQIWLLDELSVQVNSSDDYDRAWQAEIERRTAAYDRGETTAHDWDEVEAKLRARLQTKQ